MSRIVGIEKNINCLKLNVFLISINNKIDEVINAPKYIPVHLEHKMVGISLIKNSLFC